MFHVAMENVDAESFSGEKFSSALMVITERVMGSGNSNKHGFGANGRNTPKHIDDMSNAFYAGASVILHTFTSLAFRCFLPASMLIFSMGISFAPLVAVPSFSSLSLNPSPQE